MTDRELIAHFDRTVKEGFNQGGTAWMIRDRFEQILNTEVDPSGCCGDASWRGRLCAYHSGYRDALDVITS